MAITIPQIFATQNPMYEGLLGAEDAAALSQRSNIAGLLGAAATLATGMGSQGPRRSALQNVLGALAAGYGTSGQAYQAGIEQMANAQKLAQAKLQMQQNAATQQAINQLRLDPNLDEATKAALLVDPAGTIKNLSEQRQFQKLREQYLLKAAPTTSATQVEGAPMTVTGNAEIADLERQINESLADVAVYRMLRKPQEAKESVLAAEKLRERQMQLMAADIDIQSKIDAAPEQFKSQYQFIAQLKPSLNPKQFADLVTEVDKAVLESGKQYKYDGIVGQYAYNKFGTNDATKLTAEQNKDVMAFQNAPTAEQAARISNEALRLRYEIPPAAGSVTVPAGRSSFLTGNIPQAAQTTTAQAPQIIPRGPIPPMENPPAPQVPVEKQRIGVVVDGGKIARTPAEYAKDINADKTIDPATKKAIIDRYTEGYKILQKEQKAVPQKPQAPKEAPPLIESKNISPKDRAKMELEKPGTISLARYSLEKISGAREAAQELLNRPDLIKAISASGLVPGAYTSFMSERPGTPEYEANNLLQNLQTRAFVTEIQSMRQASPTGGAVGSVTEREMTALGNVGATLKVGMSEAQLRKQLKKYFELADRALNSIPKEYRRSYRYEGEFDDVINRASQQPQVPKGVTVKKVK